jgi:hypothetical protein
MSEAETIAASKLGWAEPWPEMFERGGKTYERRHETRAANGELQCAEYQSEDDEWLMVYAE